MIPANIDYASIVEELNRWGLGDYKLEAMCGYSRGYITHLKAGSYRDMTYQRAARLYNLWYEERAAHERVVPVGVFQQALQGATS